MKKNILIIDDSALMRRLMSDIINEDERFIVCDTACDGLEALQKITESPVKFDVVLLDINMPKMNGIEFLAELNKMIGKPRVIVVSSIAKEGTAQTIRLLEQGAFDFVTKPVGLFSDYENIFANKLLNCIACATGLQKAGLNSIKQKADELQTTETNYFTPGNSFLDSGKSTRVRSLHKTVPATANKLVAIASSTGGPKALQQVIPFLPKNLNAPVLIVQHMPSGFTKSFAGRLNEMSEIAVKEAEEGDVLEKGKVYIAKGGAQMRIRNKGGSHVIELNEEEPARGGLKPCADIMYESLLECDFDDITCVVLTGMGGDGTSGIKQLNEKHNLYVIGQDEATCTVYGMPRVLYEAGLTDTVVPLDKVADKITTNVGVR